jgi:hypothetical protein
MYAGVAAAAPIGPKFHLKNEGGTDGNGLCVIASMVINGAWQGVEDLDQLKESALWRTAKSRPGGYWPERLERILNEVYPGAKWFSWEGDDCGLVEHYSSLGYPVAATMNTGQLYGYAPIHHMISLIHLDTEWACVVDNNDPGRYHWMTAQEYGRRFKDGPKGWGVVWLADPARATPILAPAALVLAASGLLVLVLPVGPPRRLARA